jgi:hypothetical protein
MVSWRWMPTYGVDLRRCAERVRVSSGSMMEYMFGVELWLFEYFYLPTSCINLHLSDIENRE